MENVQERLQALEQQMDQLTKETGTLKAQTSTLQRRLWRWRGIASCLGLLAFMIVWLGSSPAGKAEGQNQPERGMKSILDRLSTLENKLQYVTTTEGEVLITGANLHIVNGLDSTETTNGLGNLIVGYNELRANNPNCGNFPPRCTDNRTGSHNIIVGRENNYSSFGGLVIGLTNETSNRYATVSGGVGNVARGIWSTVSGGVNNTAGNQYAVVSGGVGNFASGAMSAISGGTTNIASGDYSSISGGSSSEATGRNSWLGGGVNNVASGRFSSVSGGRENTASGEESSVSGGFQRLAAGQYNWAAGPLSQPQ